jgi:hypothetical protein
MIAKLRTLVSNLFGNWKTADKSVKEMEKIFEGLKLKKKLDRAEKSAWPQSRGKGE